ncbi:MAG: methionyl-tRNA formyltransferase [Candidatus Dojkabacteria bacterium]
MNKIKTIFIGSGEFAVPVLQKLREIDFIDLAAVVTQPDKPVGRKQELTPTPVGEFVKTQNSEFEILKPIKIRQISEELLEKFQPELIIVAAYGQIIPNNIIDSPKYSCLNIHGSLLPLLRGAVPVPMAILQGFTETGVTIQKMAEKMDEGDVVTSYGLLVASDETTETLMSRLSQLAVDHLEEDLRSWTEGKIQAVEQDHSKATYCYKDDISKDKAEITFETDAKLAERMVRAFYPWPVAWVKLKDGKVLKIFHAKVCGLRSMVNDSLDKIKIEREGKSLFLNLRNGSLELLEVQLEGKQRRSASDYLFLAE